jgi:transposase InsO family protein
MGEHRIRITRTKGMNSWRAGCGESCTSGSEGGLGKPAGGNSGTAPQPDPYTEHHTTEGKLYCCAVKDVFSNRIVGCATDSRMTSQLAVRALHAAVELRDLEPLWFTAIGDPNFDPEPLSEPSSASD